MLMVVLVVAVVGLLLLAVAILTANTILALVVIALAALGLLLLARDWFRDRRRPEAVPPAELHEPREPGVTRAKRHLEADLFEPDVSYEDTQEEQEEEEEVTEHHGAGRDGTTE